MAKKKRSAAQIRATKKLVALNKKRRIKKKVVRRKSRPKKKAVKRITNPRKSVYLVIAKNRKTGKEGYYTGKAFDTDIKKAIMSNTKSVMKDIADNVIINRRQWDLYVLKK